jgi:hypothetical protein
VLTEAEVGREGELGRVRLLLVDACRYIALNQMFYLGKHTGGHKSEVISVLSHSPRHHSP